MQGVFDSLGAVPDDQMPEEAKLKKARKVLRALKEASAIKQMKIAVKGTGHDPGTHLPEPRHIEALEEAILVIHYLDFKPKGLDDAKETLYDWKHEYAQHWLYQAQMTGEELAKSKDLDSKQVESQILRLEVAIGDARKLSPPFRNTKLLDAMENELQILKIPKLEAALFTCFNSGGLEEVEAAIGDARRFLPTTPDSEMKSQLMETAEAVTLKLLDMLKEELKAAVAAKKKSHDTLERLLQISFMFQKNQDLELDELQEKAQECMDEMERRRKVQQIWETSGNITDASMVIGGKDLKFDPMSKKQLQAKEQEFREFVRNEDDRVQTKREQDEDRIMARKALEAERKALREAEEFEKAEKRAAEKDRQETKRKQIQDQIESKRAQQKRERDRKRIQKEEREAVVEREMAAKQAAKQAELDRQAEKRKFTHQGIEYRKEQQEKEKERRRIRDEEAKALVEQQELAKKAAKQDELDRQAEKRKMVLL